MPLFLVMMLVLAGTGLASPASAEPESVPAASSEVPPPVDGQKAIVSFVSPGHLFPEEGTVFHRRDHTTPETYRPLAAYDKPHGVRIGNVRMANIHCVGIETKPSCDDGLSWYLQLRDGRRHPLAVREYSYGTNGMLSYAPSIHAKDGVWSEIASSYGSFWVVTLAEAVFPYVQVASYIQWFDRWCETPDLCTPVTPQMAEENRKVVEDKYWLIDCYNGAYRITDVVTVNNASFYQVALAEVEAGKPEPRLPKTGFIPVHNLDGSHTGTFSSRGC